MNTRWNRTVLTAAVSLALTLAATSRLRAEVSYPELYRRGVRLARTGNCRQAIRVWRHLLREGRNELSRRQRARVCVSMAKVCAHMGNSAAALKCVRAAQRLAPQSESLQKLAKSLEPKESFEQSFGAAVARMECAILSERLTPGQGQDVFRELEPVFRRAISKGYRKSLACCYLGTCLLYSGNSATEAEETLIESSKLDENNPETWYQLAVLARRNGTGDAVIENLERCMQAGRASNDVLAPLIKAYGERGAAGDEARAIELVNRFLTSDPQGGTDLALAFSDVNVRSRVQQLVDTARDGDERRLEQEELQLRQERARQQREREQELRTREAKAKQERIQVAKGRTPLNKHARSYWKRRNFRALQWYQRRQMGGG